MAWYICKNKGNCGKADAVEQIDVAPGASEKCPECGMTLKPAAGAQSTTSETGTNPRPVRLIIGAAIVVTAALAGTGYAFRCSLPVLGSPFCKVEAATTESIKDTPPPAPVAQSMPVPTQTEQEAKVNCQKAVEAVELDRLNICNRANAITLTNSGALSATMGKLDDAEKDYQTAIAKDPRFDGVYVNYAALKVRQGKLKEATELINTAIDHGFKSIDFIEQDPVFAPLLNDAEWGKKVKEKFNSVRTGAGAPVAAASQS